MSGSHFLFPARPFIANKDVLLLTSVVSTMDEHFMHRRYTAAAVNFIAYEGVLVLR